MSETDSFIEEVTEEVRRDKLFALMRRYGWIAVLAVLLIVGGAGYNEWRKAQDRAQAEALGDSILGAMQSNGAEARVSALTSIDAPEGGAQAIVDLIAAAEQTSIAPADAASRLLALADTGGVESIYRQLATLKAVSLPGSGLSVEDRRARLDGLVLGGGLIRLLAEEQLAYIELETGNADAALDRMQQVVADAEATAGLRQRASQVIVALGGTPDFGQPEPGVAAGE